MYIFLRTLSSLVQTKRDTNFGIWDEIQTPMRVWPTDIDLYLEVNNGRYLTMMDIGRFQFGQKIGLMDNLKTKNWGIAVAGTSVRYRKRMHMFQKLVLHTRVVAIDERWTFFQQVIKRDGQWCVAALIRTAVTSKNGVVPTQEVAEALGGEWEYRMPEWVIQWDKSDQLRPWEG